MTRLAAITGATGYVGRFVVAELQRQGIPVRALARPGSDRGGFGGSIDWLTGDLQTPDALTRLVSGADAVIHLAYTHVPGRYRGGEGDDLAGWLDANLTGSLRLLTAAQQAGVGQFVFLSSRAVFSRTEPGRALDETHPVSPDTYYGAYKVAVEAFLQSSAQVHGLSTLSVRATGVYGLTWPLARSKWWSLVGAVLDGTPIESGGGGTEVHGTDVARVIAAWLGTPTSGADVIHLSDRYVTHREVVRLARQFAGLPGVLPPAPSAPPANPLVSRRLADLGMTLGGVPALEATIAELVQAARHARGYG